MSDAPRMPIERASAAASLLMARWQMNGLECTVCGSIRRRAPLVGDIDLIAPLPPEKKFGGRDVLFEQIDASLIKQGDLFAKDSAFCQEVAGVKPWFKAASLRVQLAGVSEDEPGPVLIPVQICRYTRENRGWMEIYKTGPTDFGIWFLSQWKKRHGIAFGDEGKASVENHLVDSHGITVPVPTELDAFRACGLQYIEPHFREAHALRSRDSFAREQREALR